jgi:hypothetical protein
MAISTFDELKQALLDFSHRDDVDLLLPQFISMAEQEMYANSDEILRVRSGELRSTSTTATLQYLALPDDFQSMRALLLEVSGGQLPVTQKAPTQMQRLQGTGQPTAFAITSQIEFNRVPDSEYPIEMQYFATAAPLSDTVTTNTVLGSFPNVYLFGGLWALFEYAMDEEQAQKYYARFIRAIKGANKKDKQGRYGPAPAMSLNKATP